MRSLAVIPVATCVLRTGLLQLRQERDEPFRALTARVRGKAETCAFSTTCECGKNVDCTDHVIRDVLLNGISDADIRREVLGTKNVLQTPVNDVIALVENKEMARNALPSSTLSAVSSFKRQQEPPKEPPSLSGFFAPYTEMRKFKEETTYILDDAKFKVHKWESNIKELEDQDMTNPSKILGQVWDKEDDTLEIKIPPFSEDTPVTKKTILSHLGKVYDPLDILSPTIAQGKHI
ncbi:uncharacterized protein [Montipora foliosa]|uniref:uncharacterized protein n=1 Tax=Montipora foliosa TaxID=591990 RepID=UPI0035F10A6F